MNQAISDARIIECLNTDYGIPVFRLTFLPLGADMNASVYKAEAGDQSYFIKLKRGYHHDISATIVAFLHNAGIQLVEDIAFIDQQLFLTSADNLVSVHALISKVCLSSVNLARKFCKNRLTYILFACMRRYFPKIFPRLTRAQIRTFFANSKTS
jgi:hypothetical protein